MHCGSRHRTVARSPSQLPQLGGQQLCRHQAPPRGSVAAWCFQSFTQACGSSRHSGKEHNGVPSEVVGNIVQEVKSMPIPTTEEESTPLSSTALGTAVRSTAM